LGNPAVLQDLKAVQDFALAVDDFDNKNEGLNLNLKWKLDSANVYNLNGMEIGEANW
jgi:ATP-dependent RNA circularization protein (DNA/RNA ligase family)